MKPTESPISQVARSKPRAILGLLVPDRPGEMLFARFSSYSQRAGANLTRPPLIRQ